LEEAAQVRLCAEYGRILRRWQIWPEVPFYLERCGHCTSVWFDQGEWQALRARNLYHQVHLFFSDIWQRELWAEEMKKRLDRVYRERFGGQDYARIQEIRAWLDQHPQRGALLAFLSDRDPYGAVS
jgi:Zn-finger nucleic acid-binding protein